MTDTPIYAALVVEQKFDPEAMAPILTHEDRLVDHGLWLDGVLNHIDYNVRPEQEQRATDELAARRANPGPSKARRPAKKAANR